MFSCILNSYSSSDKGNRVLFYNRVLLSLAYLATLHLLDIVNYWSLLWIDTYRQDKDYNIEFCISDNRKVCILTSFQDIEIPQTLKRIL